ncbi:hypothetical protein PoB_007014300 [Plakobranchus ocellatus]|uniref:Uncharacterized protein n=1 Tax=Plakobranchus ocellatus TaxID=259542 RepID=A0AAV4DH54_9GAST|nr:hypothetical protein PoB_007014300 [Plakobranchus ocellatus]
MPIRHCWVKPNAYTRKERKKDGYQNLWEDFVNAGVNESGKVADSEENDGEMGEVIFPDLQPVALVSQDQCDADTSGEDEANIENYNPAPDVWKSKESSEWKSTPLPTGKTPKKNID